MRSLTPSVLLVVLSIVACDTNGTPPMDAETGESPVQDNAEMQEMQEMHRGPAWVLRDGDGNALDAMVTPHFGYRDSVAWHDYKYPSFGNDAEFPCVRVEDLAGFYMNVSFSLETGTMTECNPPSGGVYDQPDVFFFDDACEGAAYISSHPMSWKLSDGADVPFSTRDARRIYTIDGVPHFADEAAKSKLEDPFYRYGSDPTGATGCHEQLIGTRFLAPLAEVPESVVNALPNPPYTLAMEYP